MAITIFRKPAPPKPITPIEPVEYTILNALAEVGTKKGVLMLVHKKEGFGYQVKSYDPETQRAKLKGPNGQMLNPRITERECKLYFPQWRS